MYDLRQTPIALKTLTEKQGFKDNGNSLKTLWDAIVEKHSIGNNDDTIGELYRFEYNHLDTWPRGAILDILATTVTKANWWPTNGDSQEDTKRFLDQYVNNMITVYGFGKESDE